MDDGYECSAGHIAIVVGYGCVPSRLFIKKLVVAAGDSDNHKAGSLKHGNDLPRF
jgi:hypothetical protein